MLCAVVHSSIAAASSLSADSLRAISTSAPTVHIPPAVPLSQTTATPPSANTSLAQVPRISPSAALASQVVLESGAVSQAGALLPHSNAPASIPLTSAQLQQASTAASTASSAVQHAIPASAPAVAAPGHASSAPVLQPVALATPSVVAAPLAGHAHTPVGLGALVPPSLPTGPAQAQRAGQAPAAPAGPSLSAPQDAVAQAVAPIPASSSSQPTSATPSTSVTPGPQPAPSATSTAPVGPIAQPIAIRPSLIQPSGMSPAPVPHAHSHLQHSQAALPTALPTQTQPAVQARQGQPGVLPGQLQSPGARQPHSTAATQRAAVGGRTQVAKEAWQLASDVLAAGGTSTTVAAVSTAAQQVGPCCSGQQSC